MITKVLNSLPLFCSWGNPSYYLALWYPIKDWEKYIWLSIKNQIVTSPVPPVKVSYDACVFSLKEKQNSNIGRHFMLNGTYSEEIINKSMPKQIAAQQHLAIPLVSTKTIFGILTGFHIIVSLNFTYQKSANYDLHEMPHYRNAPALPFKKTTMPKVSLWNSFTIIPEIGNELNLHKT